MPNIARLQDVQTLDEHMGSVAAFNPNNLPRRPYLSGQETRYRNRFWMQTPMFLQRGPKDARGSPPAYLHPWVVRGDQDSNMFRANPDRPRLWAKVGNDIVPIGQHAVKTIRRGDVVAVSFTVTYHMTSANWFPQFHPADIVLLKSFEGDGTDYSSPAMNLYSRPPPSFDNGLTADGKQTCC